MRDAFGGAFSIKLMLIFLMLYIAFICVALNYARAFRVKNRIINIIEQNEGYPAEANKRKAIDKEINDYLKSTGYHVTYDDTKKIVNGNKGSSISSCKALEGQGYCIVTISTNPLIYRVETYMIFKLPIIETFTGLQFPIRVQGETRRIETLK